MYAKNYKKNLTSNLLSKHFLIYILSVDLIVAAVSTFKGRTGDYHLSKDTGIKLQIKERGFKCINFKTDYIFPQGRKQ